MIVTGRRCVGWTTAAHLTLRGDENRPFGGAQ